MYRSKDTWHHAAIARHRQLSKLFPLNSEEIALFRELDVIVISQLFATNDLTGILDRQDNEALVHRLRHHPFLMHKRPLLRSQLRHNCVITTFLIKTLVAVSTLALLFRKEHNVSQTYKKVLRQQLHSKMKLPPSYGTRERDGVYVPKKRTFKDALLVLSLPLLYSKIKETAFQILNCIPGQVGHM
jgi:hypothetical protein